VKVGELPPSFRNSRPSENFWLTFRHPYEDWESHHSRKLCEAIQEGIADSGKLNQGVRIQVDSSAPTELRIGQTASVAISHGPQSAALHNRLASIRSGQLSSSIGSLNKVTVGRRIVELPRKSP
jgi:hypothetical protein